MSKVVWFDIPVADMTRAIGFYEALTGDQLVRLPVGEGKETAIFASEGGGAAGCLFAAPEDEPSQFGSRVYFDAGPSIDGEPNQPIARECLLEPDRSSHIRNRDVEPHDLGHRSSSSGPEA